MGTREDGLDDRAHAGLEASLIGPELVEAHEVAHVFVAHGTPVGLRRQALHDLFCARQLLGRDRGTTREDGSPARRVGHTHWIVGAFDGQAHEMG